MVQSEILRTLGAGFFGIDGDRIRSKRVERLVLEPLIIVLDELSRMEREATSAISVRLIATTKQVLVGKVEPEVLETLCQEVCGIL